jgi:hypothetical protein
MARRRHEFAPLRVTIDVGDDGIAVLTFSTEEEDIALTLDADVFLRLRERIERAQTEKVERVAKQSAERRKR